MPLDRRFLPEEIKTVEQLHELLNAKRFEEIAEFLKWARQNLAKLDTLRFALFTKFKANLLKQDVKLSDSDLLSKSVSEIADMLRSQLGIQPETEEQPIPDEKFGYPIPKTEEEAIKETITADVSVIEDERQEFRKALLGEEYKCIIKRGSALQFSMNKKGTRVEIVIPSNWDIEIEDALLLDLYDKRFAGRFEIPKAVGSKVEESESVKSEVEEKVVTDEVETNITETYTSDSEIEESIIEQVAEEQPEEVSTEEESEPVNEEPIQSTEEPSTPEQETEGLSNIHNFILNKLKEPDIDFYKLRAEVIKFMKHNPLPDEFSSIEGGDAKKASTIIGMVVEDLVREGKVSISDIEGKVSSRILKSIKEKL